VRLKKSKGDGSLADKAKRAAKALKTPGAGNRSAAGDPAEPVQAEPPSGAPEPPSSPQ
jgi:hypothetical protein